MKPRATIVAAIEEYMVRHQLNLTQLAKQLELNPGTLSSILNGNRPLAVDQLERITMVLGFPRGHFYKTYISEYLHEKDPDWRRVKPLIHNCAELGQFDRIREIVGLLLDNPLYAQLLFDLAEELYEKGEYEAAGILYENVAMTERKQHSERLALCQYRLFLIGQGTNQDQNYQSAIQFEPYIERLDEASQLDALRDLANTYRALNRWDRVESIAQRLEHKAKVYYFSEQKRKILQRKTTRPLFYYLAYSYLLLGSVHNLRGEYDQALLYIQRYHDLSWVRENDPETLHWRNLFREWAYANALITRLSSGDITVLDEYVTYCENRQADKILMIFNLVKNANRHDFSIEHILERFKEDLAALDHQPLTTGMYSPQFILDRISQLYIELADYDLRRGKYPEGFRYLLKSLEQFNQLNNSHRAVMVKYVELFERYRNFATPQVIDTYEELISKLKKSV
ncbi:transcriptional regulator [Paenibacillus sp. MB22_1]|uniref:transcriptional regulator n=1 Tax=Paenibacillus sp. MB22_1 TaxID=3383121 RepID=UPI0039A14E21